MIDRDWIPGDEITIARLNATNDAVRASGFGVDPSGGIETRSTSYGTTVKRRRRLEMWVKITSAGSGGAYGGTQQVETDSAGGWADGPKVFGSGGELREANASTTVPTSPSPIVRAWRAKYCWRFEYGAC